MFKFKIYDHTKATSKYIVQNARKQRTRFYIIKKERPNHSILTTKKP